MPAVEIDEADLLRLRRNSDTVNSMLKSPSAKRKLLQALKEVKPDDPAVKELEQPDPTEVRFDALEKRNAELAKQIEDDKTTRERDGKLSVIKAEQDAGFALLRQDKWTDEGIEKVRKVMEEKGILDVAIAAKWIESQMPPQNPVVPGGGSSWNFMDMPTDGDADLKKLVESKGENEQLLRKMAHEAISEVRGSPRR